MPIWSWIIVWVALIGGVAVLYLRERRTVRTPVEVDRFQHEAHREAAVRAQVNGPNVRGTGF